MFNRVLQCIVVGLALWVVPLAIPFAHSQGFVEAGRLVDSMAGPADIPFGVADVDGDGLDDLLFVAGQGILLVVGKSGNAGIQLKQSIIVPQIGTNVGVVAFERLDTPHVITLDSGGAVRHYGGWPLREHEAYYVRPNATSLAVADVNADGNDELVVVSPSGYAIYSLDDGAVLTEVSAQGFQVAKPAQLDADPALELILGGYSHGKVVDSASGATEWQSTVAFGRFLATGNLGDSAFPNWVGSEDDWGDFRVFQSAPWSSAWTGITGTSISALATASIDSSGRDVVLVGDGSWGSVRVFDSFTHQQRFEIPHAGMGIKAIAALDIDGDGTTEIVFSPKSRTVDIPIISIASSQTGATVWQFDTSEGPKLVTALGDVDGDGHVELVAASHSLFNDQGTVRIYDFDSGELEWMNSDDIGFTASRIELLKHAQGAGMDIVVAGASNMDGRIVSIDGVTRQLRFRINASTGTLDGRAVNGLRLHDYNSDGTDDLVVATQARSSSTSGARLHVFSGINGATLWTSPSIGPAFAPIHDVLITGTDDDRQFIAVLAQSLQAFAVSTGDLAWTLASSNDGAIVVPDRDHGSTIATYLQTGSVTFYSASTQEYLRSFAIPEPLSTLALLGGDIHSLVAQSGGALALVDGESGHTRAVSEYLGTFPERSARPAMFDRGDSGWIVSTGSQEALFRLRLEHTDRIFADGLDGQVDSSGPAGSLAVH